MLTPIKDWDDAFANMAHVQDSEKLPQFWSDRAAAYRASGVSFETDIAYGEHQRERFDLIWPEGTPKGLVVFIHGGYWIRLDKSYWTDLAEGARALGWAVCIPSYTLAPEVRIHQITKQMGAAITKAGALVNGPIRLSGHSAGGHLAARMVSETSPLPDDVLARIEHTLSISGVHDLRPLMQTAMNEVLHIDEAEALIESPVLLRPATASPLTCWVGGGERPEFIRQSQLMAQMWEGLDVPTVCTVDGEHDHFTVIEGLKDMGSVLTRCLLK